MANAFADILGFAGKAADGLLTGGQIGGSRRANKFADLLDAGEYDQAAQYATRQGEGGYAQMAQQRGRLAKQDQDEELQQLGRIAGYGDSITDPQMRVQFAEDVINLFDFDEEFQDRIRTAAGQERGFGTLYQAYVGGANGEETFGVTPQFIRGEDGQVRAVQFGNRGNVIQQQVDGAPIPLELRQQANDISQQRVGLGYYTADPNTKGAQSYASGLGGETGKRAAAAQFDMPKTINEANEILGVIDKAMTHPGFNSRYGFQGAYTPAIAGTPGADFETIRNQLQGKAFLQAFESLKGGGQITEAEGKKATDAKARIFDPKQSPQAAREAFMEFRDIVLRGVARAEAQASVGNPYQAGSPSPAQQTGAPQPGVIEDGYRFLGGDPADPNNWEQAQ